jgi:hypothetical protein
VTHDATPDVFPLLDHITYRGLLNEMRHLGIAREFSMAVLRHGNNPNPKVPTFIARQTGKFRQLR